MMSWGHDEYLYRVLVHNRARLPRRALYMIRYHSFYPWHAGGDYQHLISEEDDHILQAVRLFKLVISPRILLSLHY
ncbi:PREDICTED: inositol oxygenase-like [Papilio polytes]|uniref:inositol oxygenase-like n=1 Tax=Papilio polytes TaxID=76194 RepID=UPI000676039D|nr:PREDICTED: inositol oxygenase-like [Papilio polytes]